jgi:hypothetical protein
LADLPIPVKLQVASLIATALTPENLMIAMLGCTGARNGG